MGRGSQSYAGTWKRPRDAAVSTRRVSGGLMIEQLESVMSRLNAARAAAGAIEEALPSMLSGERLSTGRRLVGLRAEIARNSACLQQSPAR